MAQQLRVAVEVFTRASYSGWSASFVPRKATTHREIVEEFDRRHPQRESCSLDNAHGMARVRRPIHALAKALEVLYGRRATPPLQRRHSLFDRLGKLAWVRLLSSEVEWKEIGHLTLFKLGFRTGSGSGISPPA